MVVTGNPGYHNLLNSPADAGRGYRQVQMKLWAAQTMPLATARPRP